MNTESANGKRSPLERFALFCLVARAVAIGVYYFLADTRIGTRLALSWRAIGNLLAMIVWGRARRDRSEIAALSYLAGLALLLFVGIVGAVNSGAGRLLLANANPVAGDLRVGRGTQRATHPIGGMTMFNRKVFVSRSLGVLACSLSALEPTRIPEDLAEYLAVELR